MAKQSVWVIIAIIALIAIGMFMQKNYNVFSISGAETMTRTLPTTVNPGQTFTVTYTAIGTVGDYGVSVIDTVIGGCTSTQGAVQKFVLTSPATTYQVTFNAPSSGSCTFTGDYKFGDFPLKTFTTASVQICQPLTCAGLGYNCGSVSNGCGGTINCGTCGIGQQCQSNVCFTCNTNADTDCNGIVSRDELGTIINNWVSGTATRDDLGKAITAWAIS